jgi:dihydrofolate reductase
VNDQSDQAVTPRLVIVAAVAKNRVIGDAGRLPWRLPSDLRRFKTLTMGKPLLMGRKTYESIGRPLPGRETIVLTRDPAFAAKGAHIARDIARAIAVAAACNSRGNDVIIVGGGELYRQLIDRVTVMHLTEVDLEPEGDAFFPPIDPAQWTETAREAHPAGNGDEAPFAFVDYVRR